MSNSVCDKEQSYDHLVEDRRADVAPNMDSPPLRNGNRPRFKLRLAGAMLAGTSSVAAFMVAPGMLLENTRVMNYGAYLLLLAAAVIFQLQVIKFTAHFLPFGSITSRWLRLTLSYGIATVISMLSSLLLFVIAFIVFLNLLLQFADCWTNRKEQSSGYCAWLGILSECLFP